MRKDIKKNVSTGKSEIKKIHDKVEMKALLFATESLLVLEDKANKEIEKFQLRNDTFTSIKEVKDLITSAARKHQSMFPNNKPFFSLMFKLNGWNDLNPNDFIKPPICAKWIKQYIYGRFDREMLPTLLAKDNPLIMSYIKKYKLFQFLNDEGLLLLEGYIRDSIEVMKISKDWEDFELKYTKLYDISVQLKLKLKTS